MHSGSVESSKLTKAIIALIGGIFCYASVPLFLRYFTKYLDAWTVNSIRYTCGAMVWFMFCVTMLRQKPELRSVLFAAIVPSIVNICGQILWAFIPYYVEAPVMAFGVRMSFVFTIIFSIFLFRDERPLLRNFFFWAGVVICIAGFITMYKPSNIVATNIRLIGMILTLLTAIFWGLYAVTVKRYVIHYPAVLAFGVISFYTAICLDILAIIFGKVEAVRNLDVFKIILLISSGIIGIAIAHVLSYTAIARLGAIVTTGVGMVSPFITSIGGYILLGEFLSVSRWLGGVMIICGAVLLLIARSQTISDITQIDLE